MKIKILHILRYTNMYGKIGKILFFKFFCLKEQQNIVHKLIIALFRLNRLTMHKH